MLSFIVIFLLLLLISSLFFIFIKRKRALFLILIFISLLSGLRAYNIGNDTFAYYTFFNNIAYFDFYYDLRIEYGFRLFNYLIGSTFNNFSYLLIIYSFMLYLSLGNFLIKLNLLNFFSILLIFLLVFIPIGNTIRQAMAISFLLLGLKFLIYKPNYFYFSLIVLFSSLFHLSAIIFFLLIPARKLQFNNILFMIIIFSKQLRICLNI
jgi:hypothetical protein